MGRIEAVFGGLLALLVLALALIAFFTVDFGSGANTQKKDEEPSIIQAAADGEDAICACYDKAFKTAGKTNVLSSDYRAGFVECRAALGVDGGEAWTAGWNARLSGNPYEASCRAYKRRPI